MGAAQNGHSAIVEILLRHGANKNTKNNKGMTALYLATQRNHTDVCNILQA